MKNLFLLFAILFLVIKLQGQNFMYVGDNSYPASEIKYFKCESCNTNSYQVKAKKGLDKYNTLEFQTAKNNNQLIVRISVNPMDNRTGPYLLSDKISIFFENGQRIVLLKPIYKETIDQMQELFFQLNESQTSSLENNIISKIQYGVSASHYLGHHKFSLSEAIPYVER